jgi:DNA-directed RNA polymerase I subunit RPA12
MDSLFCHLCESILDLPGNEDQIKCPVCLTAISTAQMENIQIITESRKDPFEHAFKASFTSQAATIREKCPKCDNPEMEFTTMQLRSVDEGQTIFYTCPKCAYKYSLHS